MPRALTGLSAEQERNAQERIRASSERRMRGAIAREIQRAMIAFAAAEGNAGAQFAALSDHRREMEAILRSAYDDLFRRAGGRLRKLGGKHHPELLELKFADRFEAAARAWITDMVANKVTPIIGTTQRQAIAIIRQATLAGWDAGDGQRALGERIMSAITSRGGEIGRWRANVIARTESHNAAQAASHEASGSLGIALRKQWVAAADERTRETHIEANGQLRDHDAPFLVGGYEAQYPGDASLPAHEIINCRCVSVSVIDD